MVLASWAVYTRARQEARQIFDLQLRRMAAALPEQGFGAHVVPPSVHDVIADDAIVVRIWDRAGTRLYASREQSPAPQIAIAGFSTIATFDGYWRVYSTTVNDNIIQVAQPVTVREKLATSLALHTMLPLIALFPAVFALVWITVGRSVKPLNDIATEVAARSAGALEPLTARNVPSEVQPLVSALNSLLTRLEGALRTLRSFIADAAHGLRSPLTVIVLQTQLAERAQTAEQRTAAFAAVRRGIERAKRLIDQLLTLARVEPETGARVPERLDLGDAVREVISEYAAMAEVRGVDLGLAATPTMPVLAVGASLRVLLGNLVDNAIRYTPSGGTVDVVVFAEGPHACVAINDTGPGISAAERQRVFDPFYRHDGGSSVGSGLGLAIVLALARQHGAAVRLDDGENGRGLKVAVRFPRF